MKMKNVCNSALGIPNVGTIEPGATGEISSDLLKKNRIVAAWVENGMLVEAEAPSKSDQGDSDDDEKDTLIEALAEYGIKKNKRSSVESLREALAEAENGADE